MNVEVELKEIKQITSEIAELGKVCADKRQALAEHLCPFVVGQRVLNRLGQEQEIANITPRDFHPYYEFTVYNIKKDGNRYTNSQFAYHINKYTPVVVADKGARYMIEFTDVDKEILKRCSSNNGVLWSFIRERKKVLSRINELLLELREVEELEETLTGGIINITGGCKLCCNGHYPHVFLRKERLDD